jgi:hypothetical protein
MELIPKGANFVRDKTLWEISMHLAGNPATPYGGNRDMVIISISETAAMLGESEIRLAEIVLYVVPAPGADGSAAVAAAAVRNRP